MLPEDVAEEAERLTRRARAADANEADGARTKRDALLARHSYVAREREADTTLVCYPADWVENGEVQIERIENTDRAIERPLEAPATDEWERLQQHNRDVAERVTERHGDVHGDNAAAFSEFMSNHYGMAIEHATDDMREEFLTEYYLRNVWPTKKQRTVIEESVDLALDLARE